MDVGGGLGFVLLIFEVVVYCYCLVIGIYDGVY